MTPEAEVPLAPLTTFGVGGRARWCAAASDESDVIAAHTWCAERGVELLVLGGGSNVIVADQGFEGLVLRMQSGGVTFSRDGSGTRVEAGAGEPWDVLVEATVARGLAGIECLSGIPGRVGGTPIQNVGAYGQEVGDTIESVRAFDTVARTMVTLPATACGFSYRTSRFKRDDAGRFIVSGVTFQLRETPSPAVYPDVVSYLAKAGITSPGVAELRAAVLAIRRRKGMVLDADDSDTRSVGSFFMNPIVTTAVRETVASNAGAPAPGFPMDDGRVKIPAAWLIERAGFEKGHTDGAVGISSKHPLALINRGGATAGDVLRLATRIKHRVVDQFGVWLRPEPIFVGFHSDADVEYLQRAHD